MVIAVAASILGSVSFRNNCMAEYQIHSVQHRQEIGGDICLTTLDKNETFELLSV